LGQTCYQQLSINQATLLYFNATSQWFSVDLVKGYNFITLGIPSYLNQNDYIIVTADSSIITYEINANNGDKSDYACLTKSDSQSKSYLDCSQSPFGFKFGIKLYTSLDSLSVQKSVPASYTQPGIYNLTATLQYYSNETEIVKTFLSTSIEVISLEVTTKTLTTPNFHDEAFSSTTASNELTSQDFLITVLFNNFTFISTLFSNITYDLSGCLRSCSFNGVCFLNQSNFHYECSCFKYYMGSSCQINTRQCSSFPCLNNGFCIDYFENSTMNTFTCQCTYPYFGNNCELKVNLCLNKTCSNNGYCKDLGYSSKCYCKSYFSGDECEIMSNALKTIHGIISTATILAICILIAFALLILFFDYTAWKFGKFRPKPKNKTKKLSK
jgi:hypothetical protein